MSRHSPSWFTALTVVALSSLLSSCSFLSKVLGSAFQKPTLTFKDARLKALSLEAVDLDLVFKLDNPNSVGVDLARVKYNLLVEGNSIVSGSPELGLKIPARGSHDLTFPTKVKFADLAKGITAILSKDSSVYRAEGEVGLNTPIGLVAVPLAAQGSFKNPRLPTLALQTPRAEISGLTRARVTVPIAVTNPNGFPVPLDKFQGKISLDGANLGDARVLGANIPAAGAKTVELGVDVDLIASGLAVASSLKNGRGTVSLDGALMFGKVSLPVSQKISLR